jgi:hypothetical protein
MFKIVPDNFVEPGGFSSCTNYVSLLNIFKDLEMVGLGENLKDGVLSVLSDLGDLIPLELS